MSAKPPHDLSTGSRLLRELLYGLSALLLGIVVLRSVYFPDASVHIGVGHTDRDGVRVRSVMLDFDTPTAGQMSGFRSVEEFDVWATGYAAAAVGSSASFPLVRVADLRGARPDTILVYVIPWSGFVRMKESMIPPQEGILMTTWLPLVLPYGILAALRLLLWWIGRLRK